MNDEFYDHVSLQISKKANYKLANLLAHKYELKSLEVVTRIERGDDVIFITVEGDVYKGVKCI